MRIVPGTTVEVTRALDAGSLCCPCGGVLRRWGWARARLVRAGDRRLRLRPRRSRCRECGRTHVLLPDWCLRRRGDVVDVIGAGIAAAAGGLGVRRVAARLGVPASTVRGWLGAHRLRGSPTVHGALAWRRLAVATDGLLLAPVVRSGPSPR